MMGKKVLAAKSGRAACSCAAAGGGIAAKNAKGAKSFLTGLTGFTGLREESVKPAKTKPSGVAWIGDIPDGWKMMVGKHVYTVQAGAPFDSTKFSNVSGFPLVRIRDITSGKSETYYTGDYEAKDVVHDGDLLVGMDGDFHVRWWQGGEALLNQRCCKIQPMDVITSRFAYYFLPFALADINAIAYATTVKHLSNWDLENVRIPLPPLPVQRAIAAYLDEKCGAIDEAIVEAKKGIEEYKAWKKSLIFEVVTGKRRVGFFNAESKCARDEVVGLPERSEPEGLQGAARRRVAEKMKPSGVPWIGDVPEGWEVMKLRRLGIFANGISKGGEFFGKGSPFVSYSDVYKNEALPTVVKGRLHSTPEEQEKYSVKKGDVFFTRTSETIDEIGFASTCMENISQATFAGFLIRFRPTGSEILPSFSKYYFRNKLVSEYFAKELVMVTRASLGQELLKSLPVMLPPIPEQRAIACYLDEKCASIDAMIAEKEALIADLEAYKKSLIYETVTGKREVRVGGYCD